MKLIYSIFVGHPLVQQEMNPANPKIERLELLKQMLETILDMLPPEAERVRKICQFRAILISESDRGCALMAAAFIDESLTLLLKKNMVDNKKLFIELFSHNGPLGTFSGKINLSYSIGLISNDIRLELHRLRKIRNEFAHTAEQISFNVKAISKHCDLLGLHGRSGKSSARAKFTSSMMCILMAIEEANYTSKPVQPPEGYNSNRRTESINEFKNILANLGRDDFNEILEEFE